MKFGLIGCGGIGQIRAAAINAAGGMELTVVADVDRGKADAVAGAARARVETDWRKLLSAPEVEAVIISTPPSLHCTMTIEALRAGKHVLCEKPLARDADECRAMLAAAQASGKTLATGFNYRFYPSVAKAREILDSGRIGELDHVRSYTGYTASDHGQPWLHDHAVMGGGALRDNGIHLLDLTRWFLGEVAEVKGITRNSVWNFDGCEDNAFVLLKSRDGKVGTFHASWTEWWGYKFRVEVYGSRGCVRFSCFPMIAEVAYCDQLGGAVKKERYLFPLVHVMEKVKSYRWVVMRSFVDEMREFERAARGQSSRVASGFDGLRTIEIAECASASGARE